MDTHSLNDLAGQVETRAVAFTDLEVSKNGREFDGYASVYDQETDLGSFIEVVRAPAIEVGLRNTGNLPMVWDHNMALPPFATTDAGTLNVSADRRGMRVRTTIDERHILGPTMMSMAERGELKGMSIGFITGRSDSKISQRSDGRALRSIVGFKTFLDVSPTWNPAYAGTSAELRSLAAFQSAAVLVPEQLHNGESQSVVDGPDQETTEVVPPSIVCDECEATGKAACTCDPKAEEEQRSGVDSSHEAEAAARKRRLQMMGLTLPAGT